MRNLIVVLAVSHVMLCSASFSSAQGNVGVGVSGGTLGI